MNTGERPDTEALGDTSVKLSLVAKSQTNNGVDHETSYLLPGGKQTQGGFGSPRK